jgi:putative ATP-binding cassette transporter
MYFILETLQDIDNPDQRIAEDIDSFTTTSLNFFFVLLDAMMNLASFSFVLIQIYPPLFGAIVLYAIIGTYITMCLGRRLVGLYYDKLRAEADFRFGLIRTRENAEVRMCMEELHIY